MTSWFSEVTNEMKQNILQKKTDILKCRDILLFVYLEIESDTEILSSARSCFKPYGGARIGISSICFPLVQLSSNPRGLL